MRWFWIVLLALLAFGAFGIVMSTRQNTERIDSCSAQGGHMVKRRGDDLGRHDCQLPDGRRFHENP